MTCPYPYENGEPADLWREKRIMARKPHRCCECPRVIAAGDRCETAAMLYEGRWERLYRCLDCAAFAQAIADENRECPLWGGLAESADFAGFEWGTFLTERRIVRSESP